MKCSILKQVKYKTKVDEDKDHVIIKFPTENLEYKFQVVLGRVYVDHKSQAVIATITSKVVIYKEEHIEATNKVFDWLGVPYEVEYIRLGLKDVSNLKDGVISFFNEG